MIICKFENGDEVNLRHITVAAIIVKDNKVLLEKRGTYKGKPIIESGKWALVGGYFDRDETLKEAVKREVMEEIGLEIDNITFFRLNDSPLRPMEDRQNVEMIFTAEALHQNTKTNEEVSDIKWFDLDNLPKKEEIAFDHIDSLNLYRKYLKVKFDLPVLD